MNIISPELVRSVGWVLLHFVWQGAIVALALSVLLSFCRRAAVRYCVCVGALLLMTLLPLLTLYVLDEPASHRSTTIPTEATAGTRTFDAHGPINAGIVKVPAQSEPSQSELMLWLVRAWMIGVVLFAARGTGGWLIMQRLRRSAITPATDELLRICEAVQHRMGIQSAVRFCRSAALQVPAVIGGLRPVVLLPVTALTGLSDLQIQAIVAHELAHVRRFDYFVNLFQVFAETVLFYHPAIWWINQRIRTERENCCDDAAIEVCGNRLAYVRALTHLEALRVTPQFAMAANGSPLKARVRRLIGMAEEKEHLRGGSSVIGIMLVAAVVLAATSLATGARQQPAPSNADAAPAPWERPAVAQVPKALPANEDKPSAAIPPATPTEPSEAHEADALRVVPEVVHPRTNVYVPPVHVKVPEVNVTVPAVSVHNSVVSFAMSPIQVHVPAMNVSVPAIHLHNLTGQAAAGSGSSESYLDGMKAAGAGDLSVDELIGLKVQGVTPEYVREMRDAGVKVDTDDLMALKVQGVTPEYVKQMRAAYPGIDTDTIVGFKAQGVSPEYVAEFTRLGIKADADEIMGLKTQGVTAEYVRDMRATGINFDTDELIGLKVQGVTPQYVSELKSANLGKLDADDIIGAKTMGVTPEFIEKAKSHGFKDLDLEKLIQLKAAGVL